MTDHPLEEDTSNGKFRKLVFGLLIGALFGGVGSYALLTATDGSNFDISSSQQSALLMAMVYGMMGFFVMLGLFYPNAGAKVLNVEDADELREQKRMLAWSVVGTFGVAAILVVAVLAGPAGPIAAPMALAAIVALLAVTWYASARQMRHADELMHAVVRDTATVAFNLLVLVGGGWCVLAVTGYLPAPAPLDWLTMFAGMLLLGTFWVCGRRGMLTPR